jgi:type I restriction enzyme S subunit
MCNFIIQLPSLPEQEKIANYLSSIDNKIEKITIQLDEIQQWKKGLLQGLFI